MRNWAARAPRLTVVVGALPGEDGPPVPLAEDQGAVGECGPGREHEAFGEACPTTEDRDRRCERRAPSSLNSLVSLNSRTAGSQGQRSVLPSRGEARPRRRTASSERLCRHRLQHPPTRLRAPGPAPHFTLCPRRSGGRPQIDKMAAGPTYRPVAAAGAAINTIVDDQADPRRGADPADRPGATRS